MTEDQFGQVAEMFYALFRSAPIFVDINGTKGTAAFFSRDQQMAQAKIMLQQIHRAGRVEVLKTLASAMKKVLPAEMVKEIIYRADPLSVFLKEIDAL